MMPENRLFPLLREAADRWGTPLLPEQLDQFAHFGRLLHEANQQFNLTRIQPEQMETLHFLDSLALLAVMPLPAGTALLDVGTGAGFPGIPLAIACPHLQVTLLEATGKKVRFLETAALQLGLTNVTVVQGRAEENALLAAHRRRYPLATARAVAPMRKLVPWLLPWVEPGGCAAAYKSLAAEPEIEESAPDIRKYGGVLEKVVRVPLHGTEITRLLAVIRKPASGPVRRHRKPQ